MHIFPVYIYAFSATNLCRNTENYLHLYIYKIYLSYMDFLKNKCFLSSSKHRSFDTKHRHLNIFKCFFAIFLKFTKDTFKRFKKSHWALEMVSLKSVRVLHIYLHNVLFSYRLQILVSVDSWMANQAQSATGHVFIIINSMLHSCSSPSHTKCHWIMNYCM